MHGSRWLLAVAGLAAMTAAPIDKQHVEYGKPGGHALLLDLHIPDGAGPFPAAILVHGGGFDGGSNNTNCRPLFQPLADANFAWFSIDYRMAPEFRFRRRAKIWTARSGGSRRMRRSIVSIRGASRLSGNRRAGFW